MTTNSLKFEDYSRIYKSENGYLKMPFQQVKIIHNHFNSSTLSKSERKALNNTYQFIISIAIICSRLKSYLEKYKPTSMTEVPFDYLYLDTQSFFLFITQYFEDLSLVVRLGFHPNIRKQFPHKFSKQLLKLSNILPIESKLKLFIENETSWFNEIKDIRDDILHRTFERNRKYQFPEYHEIIL